jgi:folate-binding protein YgfZ
MSATETDPTDGTPTDYRSPLLDLPGAVAAGDRDAGVAAHYGDPLREQRRAAAGAALVDRSHRGVLRVDGPDRLSWLHSLTSQHLSALRPMRGTEALLLSPHGHVEHHLVLADDGVTSWIDVEPGGAGPLLAFLESMRFLLRVEPRDATLAVAVLSVLGPRAAEAVVGALGDGSAVLAQAGGVPEEAGRYPLARFGPGVLVRRMPYGVDLLVERDELSAVVAKLRAGGVEPAGIDAFEAERIAAHRPRLGAYTDHRTIPHEAGWLTGAVHLDKGCYRGQETVARVHNLGRPPRRLVLLHLDGVSEELPAPGTPVQAGTREVGRVGTVVRHHELGVVALALVKQSVAPDAALTVGTATAAIDPDDAPAQVDDALAAARERVKAVRSANIAR